jgi:HD-like signal output (HDOD) protein
MGVNTSLRAKALQKMEDFDCLPSMPQVIERVREISEDPASSAADLANIVLSDHSLTTRILRIANSAFYGQHSGKVSTVTQAIILTSFNSVRSSSGKRN